MTSLSDVKQRVFQLLCRRNDPIINLLGSITFTKEGDKKAKRACNEFLRQRSKNFKRIYNKSRLR